MAKKKSLIPGLSFSWKRATGLTSLKRKVSKATGIPFSKAGRQQKAGKLLTGGGCSTLIFSVLLVFALSFSVLANAIQPQINVVVNNEIIVFDKSPENINGRVMIPIRFVVEKIGCTVAWDGDTQTVYINEADKPLIKTAVKTENINVFVNNEAVLFPDQQPVNLEGRVLVPVRYVAEKLNHAVAWDDATKTVYVNKSVATPSPTLTPTPAPKKIKLINITSTVRRNENVTLAISCEPFTIYDIDVYYSGGVSQAEGLKNKTSDANGNVSWTWKIGGSTNLGNYRIVIRGGTETLEIPFSVVE